ncbi:apolipoprotein D-like isoform X2 [Uloborus diversus]|nr:apolipoprotein D-like isoform X2 [Uloborus diversus]
MPTLGNLVASCVLLSIAGLTAAQFPYFGKCPSPKVQENFDMEKFKGKWYEIERTFSFLQIGAICTSKTYNDSGYEDGSIEVVYEGKSPLFKLNKSMRLIATVPDTNDTAKMVLRLPDLSLHGQYWVLSTDYDNYALVWSCNHVWLTFRHMRTENLWILSRDRYMTEDTESKVHKLLEEAEDIKVKKLLRHVKQSNCD